MAQRPRPEVKEQGKKGAEDLGFEGGQTSRGQDPLLQRTGADHLAEAPFPPPESPEGGGGWGLGDNARDKGPGQGAGFTASPDPGGETSLVGQG